MASSLNGTGLTFSTGATLNSPPVTSITAGGGLTGGTITTTGTIAVDTTTYAIGQVICGRPANYTTSYIVGNTVAGSSLYTTTPHAIWQNNSVWGLIGSTTANTVATLVNTGTWKCISPSPVVNYNCANSAIPGMWVRIS